MRMLRVPTILCTILVAFVLGAHPHALKAQALTEFEVDTTRSSLTLHIELEPPLGNSDQDESTSRLGGTISATLVSAVASFSEIHIDVMNLVVLDSIDLDFDFGFVGGLEIDAPPEEVVISLTESGPMSAITDTSFTQPDNAFLLSGTLALEPSGLVASLGIEDTLDLDEDLAFDLSGSVSAAEETVEMRIPLSISDTTEISGVPLTLQIDGIVYAISTGTSTYVEKDELPVEAALTQNYPNPFNPQTSISFSLQQPGHVILRVYDPLGRLVETLVDGSLSAGQYEAVFNGVGYPSGMYHYRLTVGGRDHYRTMVLLR